MGDVDSRTRASAHILELYGGDPFASCVRRRRIARATVAIVTKLG